MDGRDGVNYYYSTAALLGACRPGLGLGSFMGRAVWYRECVAMRSFLV